MIGKNTCQNHRCFRSAHTVFCRAVVNTWTKSRLLSSLKLRILSWSNSEILLLNFLQIRAGHVVICLPRANVSASKLKVILTNKPHFRPSGSRRPTYRKMIFLGVIDALARVPSTAQKIKRVFCYTSEFDQVCI